MVVLQWVSRLDWLADDRTGRMQVNYFCKTTELEREFAAYRHKLTVEW